MVNDHIYFDNSATRPVRKEVLKEMLTYLEHEYGNPSSVYKIARNAKAAMEAAREKVANALGATPPEIFFTSGGTESDNWAIKGVAESKKNEGNHIITSAIEHHAVLHTCQYLEKQGFEVTYLPVDSKGLVSVDDLKNAIKPTTILISIMYANNEIGTIQPIREIGAIARENKILFHTDAVQAVGTLEIDVIKDNIDMLSLSAHKLYGPKGIGALYVRKGIKLTPLIHGGAQERSKRAGTENVASIVGLGRAMELAVEELNEDRKNALYLREKVIDGILNNIPDTWLNGDRENRLPGNVNISFDGIEGESILLLLDMKGICASSGSACTSGALDPSHVLLAIGLPHEKAHGSLRISIGRYNTEEEVDFLLKELPPIITRLREMSPLYQG